ncbi:hypothetical protein RJ639_020379 [Escallonia herrerae]|uniref:Uncharacterized protein n=1 Tax=Escallonia herrerae TaxID=1293975 RepID=A0AA89AF49_9ASTE|nr:hypothetical protein RJ639_020379 [Escallonia herrerae]
MAGIMNKISETLYIGGKKEGDKQGEHKPEHKKGLGGYSGEHKEGGYGGGHKEEGHKGGLMEKIHGIRGGGGEHQGDKGEKKTMKKEHGEGHDGGTSTHRSQVETSTPQVSTSFSHRDALGEIKDEAEDKFDEDTWFSADDREIR